MQVILTVDPEIPVPPRHYGGIERIVDMLVRGLGQRGHRVVLLAHPDSTAPAQLVPWEGRSSGSRHDTWRNMRQLFRLVRSLPPEDLVVHSFARLAYLLPLLPRRIAKIQSYQRHVSPRSARWGHRLSRGTLLFTACSRHCAATGNQAGNWQVIYNGVPTTRYQYAPSVPADAPLVFLGRLERIKGPHHAIAVAQRTGRRLVLAGNLPTGGDELHYCRTQVLAHCDDRHIVYVGPVDDAAKNELLRNAAALLFPIEWEEPFGIVLVEAMACGTPVLAFPRGAVPEVLTPGVTGYLCRDVDEMVSQVGNIPALSRVACRRAVEEHFSDSVIVSQYEALYRQLLRTGSGRVGVGSPAEANSASCVSA